KASYLAYTGRIYPNLMNHTSHLKKSAKNTLLLASFFREPCGSPLLAIITLIYSLLLLYTSIYLYAYHTNKEILRI
ncbi:MAG: hypothetical protein ACTSUT_07875, partial [Promethearchaeota archaeon]